MTSAVAHPPRPFGELLRQWRERRRVSQLELSIQAEVSTRHLSFVETGRSTPSRNMVLQLAEQLDLPLRERNRLLLAAGYAPAYSENSLDAPQMSAVRDAVRQVLTGHEPYPAVVVDRRWHLLDANASLALFTDTVAPHLLKPPVNVLRASLHPEGMAPHIVNLGEWRAHLLSRLRRQVEISGDAELVALAAELADYPCDQPEPEVDLPGPGEIVVPLRFQYGDAVLTFFSTVATFGTPLDITLAELSIESFYPADAQTADALRARAGKP
ncbi:helix-turn-helix transcriptional regulator [Micromonospora sonneratiae]|uniref:Helix-turn-helix domain-containing protein n=1 Tax=Micromonospora sonneratiae TaxID=1184706 RepID=A0ABW3Y997_9ACTN